MDRRRSGCRFLALAWLALCSTPAPAADQPQLGESPTRDVVAAPFVDPFAARARVLVMTDIANEPDDQMSLVRFLLYSNQLDVEGLVATTSTWMKKAVRPDVILSVLDAYENVQPNLLKHAPAFPTAAALRGVVAAGQPEYGMAAVGPDLLSPGAELLIRAAEKADPRPLRVLAWGGTNTLAQALSHVRSTRTPARRSRPSCRSCASTRSPTRTTRARGSAASSRPSPTSRAPPRRTASSITSRPGRASAATASTATAPAPTSPPSPTSG